MANEISAYEVITAILKKQETCSSLDINNWRDDYNDKYPYTHIKVYRDDIYNAVFYHQDELCWQEPGTNIIIKNKVVICPCCGDKHRKYPDTGKFDKIKEYNGRN